MTIQFLQPHEVPVEQYVDRLRTNDRLRWYSNMGPHVTQFETRVINELLGGNGAAATVCNATIGLMLAIHAVKRSGRYAIMPRFTFAATPLAAQWCRLTSYFVDVRPGDWCPDEQAIEAALDLLGDDAAVVVTYATFGMPIALARCEAWHARGVPAVIDAAPCLVTRGVDGPFAAGFPGPVVYSLHATKASSIGEGGLVASADTALINRIRRMSSFGFDSGRECMELGLNGKMPEVSAATALATLDAFPTKLATRQRLYAEYLQQLTARGLLKQGCETQRFAGCVPHQFMPLLVPPGLTNERVVRELADMRIGARTYFSPVCQSQRGFLDCPLGPLPLTEDLDQRVLSLPLWEDMTSEELTQVVDALAVIIERHDVRCSELLTAALAQQQATSCPAPSALAPRLDRSGGHRRRCTAPAIWASERPAQEEVRRACAVFRPAVGEIRRPDHGVGRHEQRRRAKIPARVAGHQRLAIAPRLERQPAIGAVEQAATQDAVVINDLREGELTADQLAGGVTRLPQEATPLELVVRRQRTAAEAATGDCPQAERIVAERMGRIAVDEPLVVVDIRTQVAARGIQLGAGSPAGTREVDTVDLIEQKLNTIGAALVGDVGRVDQAAAGIQARQKASAFDAGAQLAVSH